FVILDTPTPMLHALSLHDALPIYLLSFFRRDIPRIIPSFVGEISKRKFTIELRFFVLEIFSNLANFCRGQDMTFELSNSAFYSQDRKSTRLNSSHVKISYAVFCLK